MARLSIKKNKLLSLVVVVVLLIFFHWLGLFNWLENGLSGILKPFLGGFYGVSSDIGQSYNERTDKRDLIKLLKERDEEMSGLISENSQLRYLREENNALREYANFYERTKYNYVLADVISRNTLNNDLLQNSNIIINRGTADGVETNLLVVNEGGIVIGKITKVKKNISEVSLVTSQNCSLAVTLQNKTKTLGISKGNAGLTVTIDFIPQTENIEIGNVVVTSGLENNIPKGMVVGKVNHVEKENNELWQNAVIEPMTNLDNLMLVSVVLPQVSYEF